MQLIESAAEQREPGLLPLSIAFSDYDRTRPLLDGRVVPHGITPRYVLDDIAQFCERPVYEEFDVAEMSFSWYVAARDRGEPVLALPIFPLRMPVLAYIFCRSEDTFEKPSDFIGKRVGSIGYRFTVNLWLRGIFQDHYGVRPQDVKWVSTLATEGAGFEYPPGIEVTVKPGASTQQLLLDGEVDVIVSPVTLPLIEAGDKRLRRVFRDPRAELLSYYRKTNILPITHTIVASTELLKREPWITGRLLRAFEDAQRICDESYLEPKHVSQFDSVLSLERDRLDFGAKQYVHGLAPNRHIVDTFVRYAHEQGYIKKLPDVESLFAPVV